MGRRLEEYLGSSRDTALESLKLWGAFLFLVLSGTGSDVGNGTVLCCCISVIAPRDEDRYGRRGRLICALASGVRSMKYNGD